MITARRAIAAALLLATITAAPVALAAKPKPDTGRMSEGEYTRFQDATNDLNRESLEFSEGVQKCVVIGQTGALADFADCMDDAYRGFRDSAEFAYFTADDLTKHTAKQCRASLRSYMKVLDAFAATVDRIHRAGSLLRLSELASASRALPAQSRRYVKFTRNALRACEPR